MAVTKPMIGLAVGGTLGLLDGLSGFLEPSLAPLMTSVITFSLRQSHDATGAEMARKVLDWTIANMWDPKSAWFYYQKRPHYRTAIRELRWCQAWMSWALACHLEICGDAS